MRKIYFLIVKKEFNNPSIRKIYARAIQRNWYWSIIKATTKVRILNIIKTVREIFHLYAHFKGFIRDRVIKTLMQNY